MMWAIVVLLGIGALLGLEAVGKLNGIASGFNKLNDAVETGIAVQQKLMRHADIRTTMNVYGDVVTDEMAQASSKIARLAVQHSGGEV
ncbi:MAG TPA: hypothetical protein VGH51_05280 [Candidatus Angelobacter sp.]|jgi:hypothetical protein